MTLARVLAVLLFGAAGCSTSGGGGFVDAGADLTPRPKDPTMAEVLGRPCASDDDCFGEARCQISELSVRPFCSAECTYRNDICHVRIGRLTGANEGTYIEGFRCVEMPEGFEGTLSRFCAPECETAGDCAALDAGFDTCAEPDWRGNPPPGYAPGGFKICSTPPADPGPPVDPITCDWEDKIEGPAVVKQICADYCDYLFTCKENPADLTKACCGWGCYLHVTPEGRVEDTRKNELACFAHAYAGAAGSEKVCELPKETCGDVLVPRP